MNKEQIIAEILNYELSMFLAVPNENKQGSCQQYPNAFTVMRKVSHVVQDIAYLNSYLQDLQQASLQNKNLMIEKYALMAVASVDNIPKGSLYEKIIAREQIWRAEMQTLYPHILKNTEQDFSLYLFCELQTLSEKSRTLYYNNIAEAVKANRNLVIERYEALMKLLGYSGLAEKEQQLQAISKTR